MHIAQTTRRPILPNHLRRRRENIFGPAPSHPLDDNAKARIWAAAGAYNAANKTPRQHQGPLTWATLRVLRVLLWRFHDADGAGRCFPGIELIATAAKCHRDTVCEALKALEAAGLLTWVNRITRIGHRERDLLGDWGMVWQTIRTSNAYRPEVTKRFSNTHKRTKRELTPPAMLGRARAGGTSIRHGFPSPRRRPTRRNRR